MKLAVPKDQTRGGRTLSSRETRNVVLELNIWPECFIRLTNWERARRFEPLETIMGVDDE